MVLAVMNTTMFNLALPAVSSELHLSPALTSLMVTGYSIIFAIASITYSRLSDIFQIRQLIIIGLTTLSISSFIAFFSHSFAILLIARLIQAAGAGSMPALAIIVINRYVSEQHRGKATSLIMSSVSLAFGLGPVLGGSIVEFMSWKYLFIIPAITIICVPIFAKLLPKEPRGEGKFDSWGAIFIGIASSGLLLAITYHSWTALIIGTILLIAFIIRIRTNNNPFIMPELFHNKGYLLLVVVSVGSYICNFATLFIMPQILFHLYDLNAAESGLIIFPGAILAIVASRKIGKIIDAKGNKGIIKVMPIFVVVSTLLMALILSTSYISILLIYMLLSVSFTSLTTSISNEISRLLPSHQIASGLGLLQLLQFLGGALSVAGVATALTLQANIPLQHAYDNIYWGISFVVLISVVCSILYSKKQRTEN